MSNDHTVLILNRTLTSEQETAAFGSELAPLLEPSDCVCLWGDLGMGKSTLARAMIQRLLGSDTDVPSPTFTLVQTYDAPKGEIWHMDLYRLEEAEDTLELGIEDAFADAVTLIEWPDRLGPWLPFDRLDVMLEQGGSAGQSKRKVRLISNNPAWIDRLAGLAGARADE